MMKRKTRQILFWSFFALFVVVSPPIVFYARGYRFDFAKKKFVPTGAIFIKSDPSGAAIYVNGVQKGETAGVIKDALAKPGFVQNLLPGEYDVRVEKQGYIPWVKKLTVNRREVTEARSIVLVADRNKPKTLSFSVLADPLISPDGLFAAGLRSETTTTKIVLLNTRNDAKAPTTIYSEPRALSPIKLPNLHLHAFSPDNRTLIAFKGGKNESGSLLHIATDNPGTIVARETAQAPLRRVAVLQNRLAMFLDGKRVLWQWPVIEEGGPAKIISASSWDFAVRDGHVYTLEGNPPTLYRYAENLEGKQQVGNRPLEFAPPAADLSLEPVMGGTLALLVIPKDHVEGTLYAVQPDGTIEKLQENVRSIMRSPDTKRLLVRTWNELWVRYFDDILTQPMRKKGEVVLVARLGGGASDTRWHPTSSDHILYTTPEGLYLTELDDRGSSRNNTYLLQGSDISIKHVDERMIIFTSQGQLRKLLWRPE